MDNWRNQRIPFAFASLLLTIGEAAAMLGLTRHGVHWLARQQRLRFERTLGGQLLFHQGDVRRLKAQRAKDAAPESPAIIVSDADDVATHEPMTPARKILAVHLARAYRLTLIEFDRAVTRQDGRCAVCGERPKAGKRLTVDHDHSTGKVRGLLCNSCNSALGLMREDVDLIYRLAAYAEQAERSRTSELRNVVAV